jgi:glycosyltransferase involved in cell wall biosynthesis
VAGAALSLTTTSRLVEAVVEEGGAIILRSPSAIATHVYRACRGAGRPFGVEVVGDPAQVFAKGAFRHPFRSAIRFAAVSAHRRICNEAAAALYVTQQTLQRLYPCRGIVFAASDVALDPAAFGPAKTFSDSHRRRPARLVTVAALEQPYKGIHVLLEALAAIAPCIPVTLNVVGAGRLQSALRQQVAHSGLGDLVTFSGQLDTSEVRAALDDADLFVLPSLTEGLPRALLEAMARGLPAVATDVGGIPELLPRTCLVRPGDASALARALSSYLLDPAAMDRDAIRNRMSAERFQDHLQAPQRRGFLECIRARTCSISVAGSVPLPAGGSGATTERPAC